MIWMQVSAILCREEEELSLLNEERTKYNEILSIVVEWLQSSEHQLCKSDVSLHQAHLLHKVIRHCILYVTAVCIYCNRLVNVLLIYFSMCMKIL